MPEETGTDGILEGERQPEEVIDDLLSGDVENVGELTGELPEYAVVYLLGQSNPEEDGALEIPEERAGMLRTYYRNQGRTAETFNAAIDALGMTGEALYSLFVEKLLDEETQKSIEDVGSPSKVRYLMTDRKSPGLKSGVGAGLVGLSTMAAENLAAGLYGSLFTLSVSLEYWDDRGAGRDYEESGINLAARLESYQDRKVTVE